MSLVIDPMGRTWMRLVAEWDRLAATATLGVDRAVAAGNTRDAGLWLPLSRFSHVLAQQVSHVATAEVLAGCAKSPDDTRAAREILAVSYAYMLAELSVFGTALDEFQRHPQMRPSIPWAELEPYSKAVAEARALASEGMARHYRALGLRQEDGDVRAKEIFAAWSPSFSTESAPSTTSVARSGMESGPSPAMRKRLEAIGDSWKVVITDFEILGRLAGSRLHENLTSGRYGGASNWGNIERHTVLVGKRLLSVLMLELLASGTMSDDDRRAGNELLIGAYIGSFATLSSLQIALQQTRSAMHVLTYIRSEDIARIEKAHTAALDGPMIGVRDVFIRSGVTAENHQERLAVIMGPWRGKMPGFGSDTAGQ